MSVVRFIFSKRVRKYSFGVLKTRVMRHSASRFVNQVSDFLAAFCRQGGENLALEPGFVLREQVIQAFEHPHQALLGKGFQGFAKVKQVIFSSIGARSCF